MFLVSFVPFLKRTKKFLSLGAGDKRQPCILLNNNLQMSCKLLNKILSTVSMKRTLLFFTSKIHHFSSWYALYSLACTPLFFSFFVGLLKNMMNCWKQALADMMEKNSKVRWGNWISYVLLPFTISLKDDPLDYVREAKATINRKKLSLESLCTYSAAELLVKLFGAKVIIKYLPLLKN